VPVKVGVPKENMPGERRVAATPRSCEVLIKAGLQAIVENEAGVAAGFSDSEYAARGARMASRGEVFAEADILAQVRTPGANPGAGGAADLTSYRAGQIVAGLGEPLTAPSANDAMAAAGVTYFALELIPRITRAQSMDVLSSMASLAGYKAVLLAANALPKMLPMMTTAAGTISPAKVLIIGAGVAGLQAIATARRLGAVVSGYDVRVAAKEQVESLGARFVVLDLDAGKAEGAGGYARAMDEAFYRRQRELLTEVIREQDILITTAAVPGQRAPILVTEAMVAAMAPGSVVLDLAAERGGNCEVTKPGETIVHKGIQVMGPLNVPSTIPYHASQMFASNMASFLKTLVAKGEIKIDLADEIVRETMVAREGLIVHERVRAARPDPDKAKVQTV
jgi:H+-translocating NAD(P) transhydrogenase subunit alpha